MAHLFGGFKPPVELSTLVGLRITLPDECLLYLLDRGDLREDDPLAQEATQDRISQVLAARRSHVSRAMGRLRARGFVKTAKVHVAGQARRRLAYFLTEAGLRRGQALRRKVEEQRLPVVDLQGQVSERRLYEVRLLLPRRPKLSELVSSIEHGKLDLRRFLDRQAQVKGGRVYDVRGSAAPPHFRGRTIEVGHLDAFFADPVARGLLVVGLPGIGKTALAAKWVAGLKGRVHVLWRRLRPETTADEVLRELADFLASAGRPALSDSLQRPPEGGRPVHLSLLRRDFAEVASLLVFDDAHLANRDTGDLLGELLRMESSSETPKVVFLARERVPYVRADDLARNRVWELELDDLPHPDAVAVLEALGTPASRREEIVTRCGGHPLSLELAGAGRLPLPAVRRTSAAWFAEEALARLDGKARRALELASVSVGRIPLAALGAEARELVRRCLVREGERGKAVVHDLIREAVLQAVPPKRFAALHARAGAILAASSQPVDAIASISHFLTAGAFDRGIALALGRGEAVIEDGFAASLLLLLDPASWGFGKKAFPPRMHVLRGQVMFALGRRAEASKAFSAARSTRDPPTAAEARLGQGKAELQRGSGLALPLLLDARERLEGLGALRLLAETQYWIGGVHEAADRIEEAREAFERGRAVAFDVGDRRWEGLCAYGLGRLRSREGDFAGAVDAEKEALRLLERGGHRLDIAKVCAGLGGNLLELNRLEDANTYLDRAASEARATGALGVLAAALYNLSAVQLERRDYGGMIPVLEEALEAYEILEEHGSAASCAAWLAFANWNRGKEDVAGEYVRRAEGFIERTSQPPLRIQALQHLARASRRTARWIWLELRRTGDSRGRFRTSFANSVSP